MDISTKSMIDISNLRILYPMMLRGEKINHMKPQGSIRDIKAKPISHKTNDTGSTDIRPNSKTSSGRTIHTNRGKPNMIRETGHTEIAAKPFQKNIRRVIVFQQITDKTK